MNVSIKSLSKNQKRLSTISFSFFFAWVLSVAFEGQILYALFELVDNLNPSYNLMAILSHFFGLILSGFFIKEQKTAKKVAFVSSIICILGSLIFYFTSLNSIIWYLAIVILSFFAGFFVASWGYYFKEYSRGGERLKTAADVLILSNILMILINVVTVNVSPFMGLTFSIMALFCSLCLTLMLDENPARNSLVTNKSIPQTNVPSLLIPIGFLFLFILTITINSGLMYTVVTPAFSHFVKLTSYYWAVPYIIALLIIRNMPEKANRTFILYIALTMIGLSFLLFIWLNRSITSYLIVNTLMLGAFGVCDLFWWSILGGLLDYTSNPAKIIGAGLSMNVLGVLIGGFIGSQILNDSGDYMSTLVLALIIIFMVIIMLPLLNNQLTRVLKNHMYLFEFHSMEKKHQNNMIVDCIEHKSLTEKETEVVNLLLQGYTYKAISKSLFISENTTKYHAKNIYQKLNINSKMELIRRFTAKN